MYSVIGISIQFMLKNQRKKSLKLNMYIIFFLEFLVHFEKVLESSYFIGLLVSIPCFQDAKPRPKPW